MIAGMWQANDSCYFVGDGDADGDGVPGDGVPGVGVAGVDGVVEGSTLAEGEGEGVTSGSASPLATSKVW